MTTTAKGWAVRTPGGARPAVGHLAETWRDRTDPPGVWRVRLTAEGRAFVASWMERHPHPVALLMSAWRSLYRAAARAGLTDEELDAVCAAAVVDAACRWCPERGAFSTVLTWAVRGEVTHAVTARARLRERELTTSERWRRDEVEGGMVQEPESQEPPVGCEMEAADGRAAGGRVLASLVTAAGLTDRERVVVDGRLAGLGLKEVGDSLGVSKERVRQLQMRGIEKMRALVRESGVGEEC